ncbi:TonB-dependent receptor [Hymenobacter sp. H14-R3]|uniref:SusC/RagA family TonB-linked outer membrane protein n=1 Tax=Hymenobacter sp. H14-R3 TaxID=3046308 RepID=UPI0024B8D0AF|nr:TonB-dependent receptor [Hymenobacter sp. H14-R3]MDJ0364657.1 TonB-dependent receptor [Hymenobacter sp. H14-R3]
MNKKLYPIGWLLRRSAVVVACGLPASFALAAPVATKATVPHHTAATIPVRGRVTGADGTGLPGVTVLVRGSSIGTTTGADGSFSLEAPEGSTLLFSYVGFVAQSLPLAGATAGSLSVTMRESAQDLNEVVVVGYGTQEKADVTGAISSISGREIATQPVADATQALQGRAAGVTVTQNSGAPGGAGGTSVRIRGVSSAGNNSPLYVVDGFPLPSADANGNAVENQLNSINPNDIESIDVLKDASATAIYGVRAANGVVIITTKRGKAGVATISLDGYRGFQQVWRRLDLLNSQQYATINNESQLAAGRPINAKYADPTSLPVSTDWQKAVFRPTAVIQSYNVSATGGSDKARYALSAGYFQQDGTLNGSNFERFTIRANGDLQLNKYVKVGNSLAVTHQEDRQLNTGNDEFGVLNNVLQLPPTIPVYNPDGTYYQPTTAADNFNEPNAVLQSLITNSKFSRNRVIGSFFAEVEPLKGLRFRTNVGADLIFDNSNGFTPSLGPNSPRNSVAGAYSVSNYNPTYLIENTATYDRTFADKHHVTVLAGQSAQQFQYSYVSANRAGYVNNNLQTINAGPSANPAYPVTNGGTGVAPTTDRLASYFGRVNYEFAGKYLLTATARYDGTSQFAPGFQFGFFPGASVGWRLSEESFIKDISTISNLKLRGGYGKVGNPLNARRFAYLATINTGITYPFGANSTVLNGAAPTRAGNQLLRWEDNYQANLGVDLGLLDNRIELSVDIYTRRSPNLISDVPPPYVSGTYDPVPTNAITLKNRGIDISLNTRNIVNPTGVSWNTGLTFSAYRNRIQSLNVAAPFNGTTTRDGTAIVRYDQGVPLGSFFGYVADGLFQNQGEIDAHATQQTGTAPGDLKFRDLNGDGVIDTNDRSFIGNPNPNYTFGLNNTVTWKGFDLTAFVQGSQGGKIYNLNRVYTEGGLYGNGNSSTRVLGRWTGEGSSNDVPRAIATNPNLNQRVSSYYVEDGSYVRLKVLSLGYNFPKALINRFAGQTLRVYVTAQNLVTLTKYTGFDPEVGPVGNGGLGIDRGIYPQSRVFLAGLNIGF